MAVDVPAVDDSAAEPGPTKVGPNDRSPAAHSRAGRSGQGRFEAFVGHVQHAVSGPRFFAVCVAIVVLWVASLPLWPDVVPWQAAIHTVTSVLTLLLLVLQENATRRSDETAQEKLNVVAEGLAQLMEERRDPELDEAATRLRQAVGLEGKH